MTTINQDTTPQQDATRAFELGNAAGQGRPWYGAPLGAEQHVVARTQDEVSTWQLADGSIVAVRKNGGWAITIG